MHEINYSDGETVELDFQEKGHKYLVNGEYVPAVTTVLGATMAKPGLIYWAAGAGANWFAENCTEVGVYYSVDHMRTNEVANGIKTAHSKIAQESRGIGTEVHTYIEKFVRNKLGNSKGKLPKPSGERAANSIKAFHSWFAENEVKFISAEEKIYNREHKFAGTVDAVAEVNGEFCLVDWKTSNSIYDEMYLQCAAYAKTADTIYDRNIEATYILRLDKDVGEYQSIRSSLHDEYFDIFIHALYLYNGLNKIKSLIKSDRA